jgi:WXG100 family type VII secretion target
MPLANQVTEADIRRMIAALNRTDANCDAAQRAVNASSDYLQSVWHGDAANRYRNALTDWLNGLSRVQQGLRELNEAMTQHYHTTNSIEGDASAAATWT